MARSPNAQIAALQGTPNSVRVNRKSFVSGLARMFSENGGAGDTTWQSSRINYGNFS